MIIAAYIFAAALAVLGTVVMVITGDVRALQLNAYAIVIWFVVHAYHNNRPIGLFKWGGMWLSFEGAEYVAASRRYTYRCWRRNFVGWWVDDGTIYSSKELAFEL